MPSTGRPSTVWPLFRATRCRAQLSLRSWTAPTRRFLMMLMAVGRLNGLFLLLLLRGLIILEADLFLSYFPSRFTFDLLLIISRSLAVSCSMLWNIGRFRGIITLAVSWRHEIWDCYLRCMFRRWRYACSLCCCLVDDLGLFRRVLVVFSLFIVSLARGLASSEWAITLLTWGTLRVVWWACCRWLNDSSLWLIDLRHIFSFRKS